MRLVASCLALVLLGAGCSSSADDTTTTSVQTDALPAPEASTVDELLDLDRPIVLAHASGENEHPHSSPFGYEDAVRSGADVLDIDVQLTSDNILIVHHDSTVDRTTNGTGDVAEMTFEEINALDNAYWFTENCTCDDQPEDDYIYRGVRTGEVEPPTGYEPDDFAVTTFRELAQEFPDFVLNIEIKGEMPDAQRAADELAAQIENLDRIDSVIVTAFDDDLADYFASLMPEVEITPGLGESADYFLKNEQPQDGRRILQLPKEYEGIEVVNQTLMDRVHSDDMVLWIWPNDRELENFDSYVEFLEIGVDGLNAAAPSEAVRAVAGTNEPTTSDTK